MTRFYILLKVSFTEYLCSYGASDKFTRYLIAERIAC